jgi:hypothetical protein
MNCNCHGEEYGIKYRGNCNAEEILMSLPEKTRRYPHTQHKGHESVVVHGRPKTFGLTSNCLGLARPWKYFLQDTTEFLTEENKPSNNSLASHS